MEAVDEIRTRSLAELITIVVRHDSQLLERAGGIEQLARADAFEIAAYLEGRDVDAFTERETPPYGAGVRARKHRPVRSATLRAAHALAAAFELGRRVEVARAEPRPTLLRAAEDVEVWAAPRLRDAHHEELWMLAVDGRGFLRAARCVARGGLHGAAARAADPVRAALRADASAFLLVHNHPSGDPTPSREDVILTSHVAAAAITVGVPLLDHVVIAREGFRCVPILDEESARAF